MDFCFNHHGTKAVATCKNCRRPVCSRCTLDVDQVSYCSPECLSELNAPSSDSIPARTPAKAAAAATVLDDVSEMVATHSTDRDPKHREPSITLKAVQADGTPKQSGLRAPSSGEHRRIAPPGTGRSMFSSSCFFHPDTSAIVRCVKCRNPICSLCAEERPEGLTCSPACGPPDPVGAQERRAFKLINVFIGLVIVAVLVESGFLVRAIKGAPAPGSGSSIETPTFEKDMESAAALLREVDGVLPELPAESGSTAVPPGTDIAALGAKLDGAAQKLAQVRNLCVRWQGQAPDEPLLETRLTAERGMTKQIEAGLERLRAPRALIHAGALCEEAASAAASKLREARKLCVGIEKEAPDAAAVRRQLKEIDDQLDVLESRFPSLKVPR